ncbi:hypothetical protein GCM10010470_56520 [Saccharopolyspora taberi]|uniref:Pentapeptide repeat-containing protein n=2 Tax=Saccharopolyspora taberi TaxID=60895 RepID=A0ABN3VKB4_9PSEU
MSPLELADVRFEDVDLSNASWQAVKLRQAEIVRSRAIGFRLSIASADDVRVDGCRWDYAAIHVEGVKGALVFTTESDSRRSMPGPYRAACGRRGGTRSHPAAGNAPPAPGEDVVRSGREPRRGRGEWLG